VVVKQRIVSFLAHKKTSTWLFFGDVECYNWLLWIMKRPGHPEIKYLAMTKGCDLQGFV
jgi:hypothetical protein